jgi:glycosyltransferase involved in cell wall biosynthesis
VSTGTGVGTGAGAGAGTGAGTGTGGTGLQVTRLRHHAPRHRSGGLRGDLGFLARALAAPPAEPPDLVVALLPGAGAAVAAARLAHRYAVPLLLVVEGLDGLQPGRSRSATARLEGSALRRATRVAVSEGHLTSAVVAHGVPAERVAVLPEVAEPAPAIDRLTARRLTGWHAGTFIVAVPDCSGADGGLAPALDAVPALDGRAELVLVAAPGQAAALAARVGDRPHVHVADPADASARALALAAADVLLVGSPRRRFPSGPDVLLDCFRAGRPVVAAVDGASPVAREIARSRGAGLVVAPGDPAVLADAVGALRADETLRAAMGEAGRTHAHHRIDRAASLLALDALVDGLCPDVAPI